MRLRIVAPIALAEVLKAIARGDTATISLFDTHGSVFGADPTHGGKLRAVKKTDKTGRTQTRYVAGEQTDLFRDAPAAPAAPIPPELAEFLDDMDDGSPVAGPAGLVLYKRGAALTRKDGSPATAAELQSMVDALGAPEPEGHRPELSTAQESAAPAREPFDPKKLKSYPPGTTIYIPDGQRVFYRDSAGQWRDDDGIKRSPAHIAHMAEVWDYMGPMSVGQDAGNTAAPRTPTAEEQMEGRERLRQHLDELRETRREEDKAEKKKQAEAKEAERQELARKAQADAAAANEAMRQEDMRQGGAIRGTTLTDAQGNQHQIPFEDTAIHLLSPSNPNRMTPEQVRAHHAKLITEHNARLAPATTTATEAEPFDAARHVRQTVGDPREIRRHRVDELFEDVHAGEVPALRAYLHTYRADLDDDVDQAIADRWPDLAEVERTTTATNPPAPPEPAPARPATTTATTAAPTPAATRALKNVTTLKTPAGLKLSEAMVSELRAHDGDLKRSTLSPDRRAFLEAALDGRPWTPAALDYATREHGFVDTMRDFLNDKLKEPGAWEPEEVAGFKQLTRELKTVEAAAKAAKANQQGDSGRTVPPTPPKIPAPPSASSARAAGRKTEDASARAATSEAEKRRARSIGDPANNAKKLREAAASALGAAQEQIGRDRLVNTARRARMAGNIVAENARKEALAKTAQAIADHIESGNAEHLLGVRAFAHIETLDDAARQAKRRVLQDEAKAKGHLSTYQYEQDHAGRPFHPDHAEKAQYPHPELTNAHVRNLLEYVKGRPDTKEAAAYFTRWMAGHGGDKDWGPVKTPEGRHHLDALLDAAEAKGLYGGKGYNAGGPRYGQPGYAEHEAKQKGTYAAAGIRDRMKDAKRLEAMGIHDEPTLQAALREYANMRAEARKADPIKEAQKELIGRKFAGYFPTPPPVQRRVMQLADVRPGQSVLEPSAGTGHLADAVRAAGGTVTALEMQPALRKILELKGHTVAGNDALAHDGRYDRIVMNPPFEQGADMHHIQHAFEHNLKPGGRLVAILSEGPFFRSDKKAQAFREFLAEHGAHNEKLPAGSFTQGDVPTGVNTRIVVLQKPDKVASANSESEHHAAAAKWRRVAQAEPDERRKANAYEMADMHVHAAAAHRDARNHNTPHMHDLAAKRSQSVADAEAIYAPRFPEVHKAVRYRITWAA